MGRKFEPFSVKPVYLFVSAEYNQWLLFDIDCLTEIFLGTAHVTWKIFYTPTKLLETIISKKTFSKKVLQEKFLFYD